MLLRTVPVQPRKIGNCLKNLFLKTYIILNLQMSYFEEKKHLDQGNHVCLFGCLTSHSTAVVMSRRSVDLTTIFYLGRLKETRSVIINIFQKKIFSFYIICKNRIKLCFHNKYVQYS